MAQSDVPQPGTANVEGCRDFNLHTFVSKSTRKYITDGWAISRMLRNQIPDASTGGG
jgi:hypothetical protein